MNSYILIILYLVGYTIQQKVFDLPISTNLTEIECGYNEQLEIRFASGLQEAIGLYSPTNKYYEISGIKFYRNLVWNKVKVAKVDKSVHQYSIESLRLYYPAYNQIPVYQDQNDTNRNLQAELQIILSQAESDTKDFNNRQFARLSIFISSKQTNELYHLPDGMPLLMPFTQINTLASLSNSQQNVEVNFEKMFEKIINEFHQFIGIYGKYNGEEHTTNIYFNKQKFYVPPEFFSTFLQQVSTFTDPISNIPKQEIDDNSVKICYGSAEETILRQNYAVWFWIVTLIVWWVLLVCSDNDTDQVFMDEFYDNKLSMIPIYSIYTLNNDTFFSKLSRQSSYLVYVAWEIMIISLLYGQLVGEDTYEVQDAIILWYAIVAILLAWPLGYFYGIMQYNFRELNKHKMLLQTDYKKITNKHSQQAITLSKAIRDDEDRQYTYWFVYYVMIFLMFWAFCLISIWQVKFLNEDESGYWLATVGVLFLLDQIVLDTILPFIPGSKRILKYRGYWYDGELAKIWKHMEEV